MASVEGMWAFLSGTLEAPDDMRDGGIVVLETGRVFGGDSAMAYVGHFEVNGAKLTANIRSWTWNKVLAESGVENVFGMTGQIDYKVVFEGERHGDEIRGVLFPADAQEHKVLGVLKKITDLP